MKIFSQISLLSFLILFVSCVSDTEETTNNTNSETTNSETIKVEQPSNESSSNAENLNDFEPVESQSPAVNNEVKLNPAHGQPGHDCAVAVGAPLNSNGSASTPTTAPTANPIKIQQDVDPTVIPHPKPAFNMNAPVGNAAAGTNPAHGQPGHNCAIPVGAPLN